MHFLFLIIPCWLLSLPHAVRGLPLADMTVVAERTCLLRINPSMPAFVSSTHLAVRGLSLADMTVVAERTITDDLEYLISQTVDPSKADYAGGQRMYITACLAGRFALVCVGAVGSAGEAARSYVCSLLYPALPPPHLLQW